MIRKNLVQALKISVRSVIIILKIKKKLYQRPEHLIFWRNIKVGVK